MAGKAIIFKQLRKLFRLTKIKLFPDFGQTFLSLSLRHGIRKNS